MDWAFDAYGGEKLADEIRRGTGAILAGRVEDAVAQARAAAGERNLELFGADLARQVLAAGLLDEIVIHLAPVLARRRRAAVRRRGARPLERTAMAESGQVVDLRFSVRP